MSSTGIDWDLKKFKKEEAFCCIENRDKKERITIHIVNIKILLNLIFILPRAVKILQNRLLISPEFQFSELALASFAQHFTCLPDSLVPVQILGQYSVIAPDPEVSYSLIRLFRILKDPGDPEFLNYGTGESGLTRRNAIGCIS